jgi:hypothetical protein
MNTRRTLALLALAGSTVSAAATCAQADDPFFGGSPSPAMVVTDFGPDPTVVVVGEPVDSFAYTSADYLGAWDESGNSFSLSFGTFSPSYCAPTFG